MPEKVVTRFAPSPTGFMHVGNVRTALFAYLWAKKNKGTFILRIEDTDKEREIEGSVEHIIKCLDWLGIKEDEGPTADGPHGPYVQSERLEIYKKYARILIDKGFWAMAHEYRTDFAMTLLLVYLLIYGGGKGSADSKFINSSKT